MAEHYPDPFEACLLLDYSGGLSVGCWISIDEKNRDGSFRQGRHGVYEKDEILRDVCLENYIENEKNKNHVHDYAKSIDDIIM